MMFNWSRTYIPHESLQKQQRPVLKTTRCTPQPVGCWGSSFHSHPIRCCLERARVRLHPLCHRRNSKHSAHDGYNVLQLNFNPGVDILQSWCLHLNPESGSVRIVAAKISQNFLFFFFFVDIVGAAAFQPSSRYGSISIVPSLGVTSGFEWPLTFRLDRLIVGVSYGSFLSLGVFFRY